MTRAALDIAPSPPSFAPILITILLAGVVPVAVLILLRVRRQVRP